MDELRTALQVQDDELRLVSPAPVPVQSVSRWAVVVVFVGGMLGLLVGIVGAFVREYSRKPRA